MRNRTLLVAAGLILLCGCSPATHPPAGPPTVNAPASNATDPSSASSEPIAEVGESPAADSSAVETPPAAESPPVEPPAPPVEPPAPPAEPPPPREEIPAAVRYQLESLGARIVDKPQGYAIDIRRKPGFTDAEIDAVIACPQVVDLTMEGVSITDAGLAKLAALPNLRRLILNDCPITGSGLETLAGLPLRDRLYSIGLRGSQVQDADLAWLKSFPGLQRVDVSRTALTDACLPALETLPLEMLNVAETKITSAGLAPLQQKLPKLVVKQQ